jgi:S-DNA-T family DNA segregation ATPase FtsK/SpoIIIE
MAQATRNGHLTFSDHVERGLREGAMWTLICLALYLILALASYSPEDPAWSYVGGTTEIANAAGRTGAWFADVTLFLFGYMAYLVPLSLAFGAWVALRQPWGGRPPAWGLAVRTMGLAATLTAGCAYADIHFAQVGAQLPNGSGGGLGRVASGLMLERFNASGTDLLLCGVLLAGFTLFTGISWIGLFRGLGEGLLQGMRSLGQGIVGLGRRRADPALPAELHLIDAGEPAFAGPESRPPHLPRPQPRPALPPAQVPETLGEGPDEGAWGPEPNPGPAPAPAPAPERMLTLSDLMKGQRPVPKEAPRVKKLRRPAGVPEGQLAMPQLAGEGGRPPLELLDPPRKSGKGYTEAQIETLSRDLEERLGDFGVTAQVVAVYPGPVVTLFELQLAPGTKASKITGLARDLARALSTISVRVVEVIPGKSVIGVEIPNEQRETVFLSEILGSEAYRDAKSPLTIALGTNISGLPVVADLARMPHALIAGTTGSGKSVAINAMILSLVYKSGPEDVRLIMVDPKMLELSVYEGIPHLLTPVVTDMKEAANALRWCVGEMERRYRLMAALGVRNIGGYNRKVADAVAAGAPLPDPLLSAEFAAQEGVEVPALGHLPYIVVIIDELADMMMVVGKKVEELIARLAQKARASGIHLLLATQRPSVDVLTGLIKANIPTRISFQVSSRIDSRTILDQMGAEQLLGHGDMLYLPPGGNIPQRIHGAFVDDHEVHRVAELLKSQGSPDYIEDVLREPGESIPGIDPEPRGEIEETDPLFDEAVQIVVESRRASISGVQRRLKIGYNRAARMIEEMERIGIVGPAETNGNREVLAPPPPED